MSGAATDQDPPDEVAAQRYRNAMARLGAAVTIVTTDGPRGRAGFTASAVCSVTDRPPTLIVCLNRASSVYGAFRGNRVLCVNVLAREHEALSRLFGGKTPTADRFAAARWSRLATGSPALDGAVANLDCRISGTALVGTHDVLFCEVADIRSEGGSGGLVYFDRAYHALPGLTAPLRRSAARADAVCDAFA